MTDHLHSQCKTTNQKCPIASGKRTENRSSHCQTAAGKTLPTSGQLQNAVIDFLFGEVLTQKVLQAVINARSTSHNEAANSSIQSKNNKKVYNGPIQFQNNVQRGSLEYNKGSTHIMERMQLINITPSQNQMKGIWIYFCAECMHVLYYHSQYKNNNIFVCHYLMFAGLNYLKSRRDANTKRAQSKEFKQQKHAKKYPQIISNNSNKENVYGPGLGLDCLNEPPRKKRKISKN